MRKIYWMVFRKKAVHFLEDWRKVAVFGAFFAITILYGLSTPKVVPCVLPACLQEQWTMLPFMFCPKCSLEASDYVVGAAYYALFPAAAFYSDSSGTATLTALLVAQVLYWYLLSLLIVWIYDRMSQTLKRKSSEL